MMVLFKRWTISCFTLCNFLFIYSILCDGICVNPLLLLKLLRFRGFSSYWSTAFLENNGSFTRIILFTTKLVKSSNLGSPVSALLILNTFLFHLDCRWPGTLKVSYKWHLVNPKDFYTYHSSHYDTLSGN